jgi:hypothetical protein
VTRRASSTVGVLACIFIAFVSGTFEQTFGGLEQYGYRASAPYCHCRGVGVLVAAAGTAAGAPRAGLRRSRDLIPTAGIAEGRSLRAFYYSRPFEADEEIRPLDDEYGE